MIDCSKQCTLGMKGPTVSGCCLGCIETKLQFAEVTIANQEIQIRECNIRLTNSKATIKSMRVTISEHTKEIVARREEIESLKKEVQLQFLRGKKQGIQESVDLVKERLQK